MNDMAVVAELTRALLPLAEAAALAAARALGLLIIFPAFMWLGVRGMLRNALALAMAAPLVGPTYAEILAAPGGALPPELVLVLVGKEILIGMSLGALFGAPFWAVEAAGTYLDVFRGASSATVAAPDPQQEPLVTGALFALTLTGIFIMAGGLRELMDALYRSYGLWGLMDPTPPDDLEAIWPALRDVLGKVAGVAMAMAAPLLIAMVLVEGALALTGRMAPQVNLFDLALSLKNLAYLFLLPPFLYLYSAHYGPGALDMGAVMNALEGALKR